ncbi:MAG TPA: hypothetical protein VNA20_16280 [Frankiaceae bacterium]|nr:hypothetical protein [Frankiaceae bacterium]
MVFIITATRPTSDREPTTGLPTDAQARSILARTYEHATRTTDALAFCAESEVRAICINQYNRGGGRASVPAQEPRIVGSWVTDETRVLTVCGVDGQGETYRSDFPVERRTDGTIIPLLDVFWDSNTYSGNKPDGEPVQASVGPRKSSC